MDIISDFLTVMRNGLMVGKRSVTVPHSNMKQAIAEVLKSEGYIRDYNVTDEEGKARLNIIFKYLNGESAIHELKRISKAGRRHYERVNGIESVIGGLGISILTTSRGLMTDKQAVKAGVGGEVVCHVW